MYVSYFTTAALAKFVEANDELSRHVALHFAEPDVVPFAHAALDTLHIELCVHASSVKFRVSCFLRTAQVTGCSCACHCKVLC